MIRLAGALLALLAVTACTGSDQPDSAPPSASPTPTSPPSAAVPPTAPPDRACYLLDYDDALEATSSVVPVDCAEPHTSLTFWVGELRQTVDGHLLAVDSDLVQKQVSEDCPRRLAGFLGGSTEDRRLTMLRPVWFTPTLEESDAGARWFRCDVVALAADEELAPLAGRLAGVLDSPGGRDRYGMCGTAEPGTPHFDRVICSRKHTWRAIQVVPFADTNYPGEAKVRAAGEEPCQDAGAAAADDALDYRWGYEWPTAEQWAAGQRYGRCWAPD